MWWARAGRGRSWRGLGRSLGSRGNCIGMDTIGLWGCERIEAPRWERKQLEKRVRCELGAGR